MFRFLLEKLKHKKWMVLCLLIGNILLIAVTASQSIYKTASFKRMLVEEFDKQWEEIGKWPCLLRTSTMTKTAEEAEELASQSESVVKGFSLPIKEERFHYRIREQLASSTMEREDADSIRMSVGYITGMQEHITITAGRMYEKADAEDMIEVIVNQEALQQMDVLLDEVLLLSNVKDENGNPLYVKIVGVFSPIETTDEYWVDSQADMGRECFMAEELFEEVFYAREHYGYEFKHDTLFDYEKIETEQAEGMVIKTNRLLNKELGGLKISTPQYLEVLNTFTSKERKISATLFILQVPCLILLYAFLFMISEQMLDMERTEISVLKSRGAKKSQILSLYFMQSLLISVAGLIIGLPLGKGLCSLLGSAGAFLEFDFGRLLSTKLTLEAVLYGVIAMGASVAMTVLPVIKYSDVSIVNLKQGNAKMKKPFWQKLYLDIILLGIALYSYYTFLKAEENIREQVLKGEALDPLLYFGATLFILGLGLLFLRLHPVFMKIVYEVRKKHLSPAAYMSFSNMIRTSSKQQFIMLFMILTVSLGIFYVTIARTILQNAENNITFLAGTDVVLEEKWKDNSARVGNGDDVKVEFYEPEYGGYEQIEGVKSAMQVLQDSVRIVGGSGDVKAECRLMGIHTKEFGEMVTMPDNLLYVDFYDYLNALANTPNGVLMSENMRSRYGYAIGDTVNINLKNRLFSLQVIGFVNYWPSYQPKEYSLNPDGKVITEDEYLMVANLSYVQRKADVTPYRIWMDFEGETDAFYSFVDENDIKVVSYTDAVTEKEDLRKDTLFQGTNGILSLSFIVILLLCGAGYLMYWIMTIRSRELLFGILRAMGMSKGEIFHILINEQIFCGIMSILAGIGIGAMAAYLYVPMIQNTYAATDQVLPLQLICETPDLLKLFGTIAIVLISCITILLHIVSKSNITRALKLGEE